MIELVKILEKAQENYEEFAYWFDRYSVIKDEYVYQISHDYMLKCETYLNAYAILTDEKIEPYEIKEVLKRF